ncbi:PepSY domain-containing protein [Spirillospora sp. CA-142024]|uniref:PepSY domain-containing protein n=1 Tax=Spirillospora sp. CA-142024 TaxID=3240036 RepID=UPI003D8BBAF8
MKNVVIAAVTVVSLMAAGGGVAFAVGSGQADPLKERKQEAAFTAAHVGQAKVSRDDAVSTAQKAHSGRVVDVHLQDEGHGLRWEVKPDDGKHVHEVQIDAQTGEIVSDQLDD